MILSSSLPGCAIDRVIHCPDRLVALAHARRDRARCPACGTSSSAVHSRYDRRPADLPSFGQTVTLHLRVRRFYCHHPHCRRHTFAEVLPRLLPARARRTRRLARTQARVGLALGGEAGARLIRHLAMPTSPDTMLRLGHRLPLPASDPPRAVGLDDWAIRKGRSYGTLLVDLDRGRPIDLLPDRSGATVAAWLRRHPGIQVVTRDRSSEYARAATRRPNPSRLDPSSPIWNAAWLRVARTPWPFGVRSVAKASREATVRCTASSPSGAWFLLGARPADGCRAPRR